MKKVGETYTQQICENLEISQQKNVAIQKRLIRIFGKFEKLMHYENRVDTRDTQKRDMLINAQRALLHKIQNPIRTQIDSASRPGLLLQLQDILQKVKCTESVIVQSQAEKEVANERSRGSSSGEIGTTDSSTVTRDTITDEDLKDMFNILKKQKQGIEILNQSINQSTRDLITMERELNLVQ